MQTYLKINHSNLQKIFTESYLLRGVDASSTPVRESGMWSHPRFHLSREADFNLLKRNPYQVSRSSAALPPSVCQVRDCYLSCSSEIVRRNFNSNLGRNRGTQFGSFYLGGPYKKKKKKQIPYKGLDLDFSLEVGSILITQQCRMKAPCGLTLRPRKADFPLFKKSTS